MPAAAVDGRPLARQYGSGFLFFRRRFFVLEIGNIFFAVTLV